MLNSFFCQRTVLRMFRTIMSILCNESTHLSNKPECQLKGLNGSISFIPGPFIGYQRLGNLLIRVLSWSLFNERGAGELSAGNTRIRSRANKNNSRKGERIQGGVEAEANLEGPLSQTALPARYFLHDLVMGGTSHNGPQHETVPLTVWSAPTPVSVRTEFQDTPLVSQTITRCGENPHISGVGNVECGICGE